MRTQISWMRKHPEHLRKLTPAYRELVKEIARDIEQYGQRRRTGAYYAVRLGCSRQHVNKMLRALSQMKVVVRIGRLIFLRVENLRYIKRRVAKSVTRKARKVFKSLRVSKRGNQQVPTKRYSIEKGVEISPFEEKLADQAMKRRSAGDVGLDYMARYARK